MIKVSIDNPQFGAMSLEFENSNELANFLSAQSKNPNIRYENTQKSHKNDEIIEEDLRKSFDTGQPSHFVTPRYNSEIGQIQHNYSTHNSQENKESSYKKISSDNRRRRRKEYGSLKIIKHTIEALVNNRDPMTPAEISNIIARHVRIADGEKTDLYRYVYQLLNNRAKKNIDIIKNGNKIMIKPGFNVDEVLDVR